MPHSCKESLLEVALEPLSLAGIAHHRSAQEHVRGRGFIFLVLGFVKLFKVSCNNWDWQRHHQHPTDSTHAPNKLSERCSWENVPISHSSHGNDHPINSCWYR